MWVFTSQSLSHIWTVLIGDPQGHRRKRCHRLPSAPGSPRLSWPRKWPCQAAGPLAFLPPPPNPRHLSLSPQAPQADLGLSLALAQAPRLLLEPSQAPPSTQPLPESRRSAESSQFSSVSQSCPTLCSPMDWSTPGLPVHHELRECTQTHVH